MGGRLSTMRRVVVLGLLPSWLAAGCGGDADFAAGSGAERQSRRSESDAAPNTLEAKARPGARGEDGRDASERSLGAAGDDTTAGDVEPISDRPMPPDRPDPEPGDGKGGGDKPDPEPDDETTLTREMSFPTSAERPGETAHDLTNAEASQELVLRGTTIDKSKQLTQPPRPVATDEHEQGAGAADVTETFAGLSTRPLDVLLVLDNGASMQQEATAMAAKLEPLLASIDATDWQIGVVTTDPAQTCLRALIKKGQSDARTAFLDAVRVGTTGSNNPRGFLQAVRSLSGECLDKPWIRDTSAVEVLVVSDQDNCADGNACPGKPYATPAYLADYLRQIRTIGKDTHFHAVVMPTNVEDCDCTTARYRGRQYGQLVSQTGGGLGNICTQNYEPALRAIGGNVTVAMRKVFTLKTIPNAGTLKVVRDGVELGSGFTLAGRTLELQTALGDGQKLEVSYEHTSATLQTTFALRYAPRAGSVAVSINGMAVDAASYAVSATPPSVTFATAPPAGARISVAYTRDVPLQTSFSLEPGVDPATLSVSLDGVPTTDYAFDPATGIVTLAAAPAVGTVLLFRYTAPGAPILSYPIDLDGAVAGSLSVVDAVTMAPVSYTYSMRVLTIAAVEYRADRKLLVRYLLPRRDSFTVTLTQDPVAGSVTVMGGGATCDDAQVAVQGRTVTVGDCGFGATVTTVVVRYRYVERYREFVFAAPNLPAPMDFQLWTVSVNGVPTTDYTKTGNVFRFRDLPDAGTVTIKLVQRR